MQKENLRTKYEMLKTQVKPHFLFNSLNVLSTLVHIDARKAEEFINQFAKTYRYLLDVRDRQVVSLAEEMELVRSYLFCSRSALVRDFRSTSAFTRRAWNTGCLPSRCKCWWKMPLSTMLRPRPSR
ncbi:MAG: histidine kinase [Cytophagales bacterium]|nr:histidine kinase [Cytophagales bacterium]